LYFYTLIKIMGRIIGIDYGSKRIGVAVSDPLQIFASPLNTVSPNEFDEFIAGYIKKEDVESFVIGYPVQMNNKPSESVNYINPFIKKLNKAYPAIKIHLADERFTSQMALRTMIDGGVKKKDRQDKSMVDKISASIILQSFLDNRTNKKENL
jgi:putative holliday junction resolvase